MFTASGWVQKEKQSYNLITSMYFVFEDKKKKLSDAKRFLRVTRSGSGSAESLFQVRDEVGGSFESHREAHHFRRDSRSLLLFGGQL